MYRIMLVDDEDNVLNALRRSLLAGDPQLGKRYPITLEAFATPAAALTRAAEIAFAVVVSDYRMPGMNGVEFLRRIRELQPNAMRLILSGHTDIGGLIGAINEANIYRFIQKPWDEHDLKLALAQALDYRHLLLENRRLADMVRWQSGELTRDELETRNLEEDVPGAVAS